MSPKAASINSHVMEVLWSPVAGVEVRVVVLAGDVMVDRDGVEVFDEFDGIDGVEGFDGVAGFEGFDGFDGVSGVSPPLCRHCATKV